MEAILNSDSKCWIFGDSFCEPFGDNSLPTWYNRLEMLLNLKVNIFGYGGSSQDWVIDQISFYKKEISTNDVIIVCLTHPSRFWFFENLPNITNLNNRYLRKYISKEQELSIKNYTQYIQRPTLDTIMLTSRLGFLNNLAVVYQWQKILVLLCFEQFIPDPEDFTQLNFSIGSLSGIAEREETNEYFANVRYNHLCLSNHKILSEKIYKTIKNNTQLDLTTGFLENLVTPESIWDDEFAKREYCPTLLQGWREIEQKQNKSKTWLHKYRK